MTGPENDPDRERLVAKYAEERAKRLRPDGLGQYVGLSLHGRLAHFLTDPLCPTAPDRPPVHRDVDVLLVGAGLSGLLCAARLAELGVDDVVQVDSAGGFGGTWYWNRYPGVRCDTESYIYLPLLEETGTVPTEKYASGAEIRAQFDRVAQHYGLGNKALFHTRVEDAAWSPDASRWIVRTDRGDEFRARFLILSTGRNHRLKLPGIPGIERFTGHSFHTGRWDYAYTGGGPGGGLTNLRDKRVAVIGTGATGIQVVPLLAADAGELFVVQRTPTVVGERHNRPTDPAWAASLEPGWQRRRAENFDAVLAGLTDEDLVGDEWPKVWGAPPVAGITSPEERARAAADYDFAVMERIRRRVDEIVDDPATAAALKPYYYRMCKRPTYNDEFLAVFNRPSVHLVDTAGRGPDEITETGFVVQGRHYPVDCIVYATGQELGASPPRTGEYRVTGRDGRSLEDEWQPERVHSLHGMHVRGFPNLVISGAIVHAAGGANITFPYTQLTRHVAALVDELLRRGVTVAEVSREADERYATFVRENARTPDPGCTPGYLNSEGAALPLASLVFPGSVLEYLATLEKWRLDGGLDTDFELTAGP